MKKVKKFGSHCKLKINYAKLLKYVFFQKILNRTVLKISK